MSRRVELKGARGPFNWGDEYIHYLNAGESFMSTTYVKDYQIIKLYRCLKELKNRD